MNAVPVVSAIPLGVVTLSDHEAHARTLLDDNAWAYLSGGAADEITHRANEHGWNQLQLQPRILRAMAGGHTRIQLLGKTWQHPILLAPVAFQRLAHADGEVASAYAAAAQEIFIAFLFKRNLFPYDLNVNFNHFFDFFSQKE